MAKAATQQTDDSSVEAGDIDLSKIPTPATARLAVMDHISDQRTQQMADDNELDVDDIRGKTTTPEEEPKPKEEDEIIAAIDDDVDLVKEADAEDQINKALIEDEENTFVTMKINGVEKEVSVADIKRDAQKVGSSTERFEAAAEDRRAAQEILDEVKKLKDGATAPVSNADAAAPTEDNDKPSVDTDAVKKVVDAIYAGKEEDSVEALTELLAQQGRGNTTQNEQPIDVETVVAQVTDKLNNDKALADFKVEYADVWKNPVLAKTADGILATQLAAGVPFAEALTASGKEVREQIKAAAESMGYTKTEEPDPEKKEDDKTSKAKRKKSIDNVKSSGNKASTSVAEDEPQGTSAVIAEMAASRGVNRNY